MGIVNVTPNSFSDGGRFFDPAEAVAQGRRLAEAGAGILDLGAEASSFFRAGVMPVGDDEQVRRLEKVLPALGGLPGVTISVDTRSAVVARYAVLAGARIINDISAGTYDTAMLETVAGLDAGVILMHMGARYPETPTVDDLNICETVRESLERRVAAAVAAGICKDRIAVDPGIGFGKTMQDNWTLALRSHELSGLGVPVVLGASRKRFLEILPTPSEEWVDCKGKLELLGMGGEHARDLASAAVTVMTAKKGVWMHRVHDVTLAAAALRLWGCDL